MDEVARLLNGAKNYPRNLARNNTVDDSLESYFEKINEHQETLFTSEEKKVDLGFCELSSDSKGSSTQIARPSTSLTNSYLAFWAFRVNSATQLLPLFGIGSSVQIADPRCRFLFVALLDPINRSALTI